MRRVSLSTVVAFLGLFSAASVHAKAFNRPHMHRPGKGCQISVGPITVQRGTELTECTYLKFPSNKDMSVHRVKIKVSGGSHHVHIYRAADPNMTLADGHETCNFALDFSVWQLVLATQNLFLDWRLPPGIAFHFRAGEQLAAQTHFVDNGLLQTPTGQGWALFNLYSMPHQKVTSYAGAFFGQDRDVLVPPHSTSTATTQCVFPKPVKLLAITGHYHYRGVEFTAGSWDGTSGVQLYDQKGYLDPPFVRYSGVDAPEVSGLQWTCTYDNETDTTYKFGPFTDQNEHCNLFAFYYPTDAPDEFTTCVQKDGVATVTVRDQQ
jgi:copper type II ascorbate-dependent monooxygenase-like protein